MMERPMINATTGLAFRADGNFAGDGKADAAVIVEVGLVNVDGDGVEAMQWWCGAEKVVGLFGFQRVPPLGTALQSLCLQHFYHFEYSDLSSG
jgi:hypothetical protein